MCTLVLLRRPGDDWPLLLAANRDEMLDRSWRPPGRHWPDRPDTVAGQDLLGGGSWLGINDHGVIAAVLNRAGSLGPAAGKRSRGELVLDALDFADAAEAAHALAALDADAYRPFNLVVADNRDAFWLANRGAGPVAVQAIEPGIAMLTEREINDVSSPRIARYRPRFMSAVPDPVAGDWAPWQRLLEDRKPDPPDAPATALAFTLPNGFGTVCHTLIGLPAPHLTTPPVFLFAAANSRRIAWNAITLG